MFQFPFMCVIFFVGQHYAVGYLGHDYEYVPDADTWLRLHMVGDYWTEARYLCKLEGGLLASPSTTALAQAMLRIMSSHKVLAVFIGIHALITEGEYESLDGVPLSEILLDWDKPTVDNYRRDACVALNTTGKVNDVSCLSIHPYFCRKETAVMNATHECQTTASGYALEPRTGSCYKFHQDIQTWHHAARKCRAEGGNLAIINSDLESQVLQDIFKKYPKDTVVGAVNSDAALIGVWKWDDFNGEWQTIDETDGVWNACAMANDPPTVLPGQTLEEAGFAKWSNELNANGYAAAVKRSGLLVPIMRFDKYPFICEITP